MAEILVYKDKYIGEKKTNIYKILSKAAACSEMNYMFLCRP